MAAKFECKPAVRIVMGALIDAGHEITHDWTSEDDVKAVGDFKYKRKCAADDLSGVLSSDAVILLPRDPGEGPATPGRWIEVGAALAAGIPVIAIEHDLDRAMAGIFDTLVLRVGTLAEAVGAVSWIAALQALEGSILK